MLRRAGRNRRSLSVSTNHLPDHSTDSASPLKSHSRTILWIDPSTRSQATQHGSSRARPEAKFGFTADVQKLINRHSSFSLSNPSQHSPSLFPFENNANYPLNNQFLQLTFNLRKDDRPSAPICDHSFVFSPPSSPCAHPLRKRKGHRMEAAGSVCRVLEISLKQARHYLGEPDRHDEPAGGEE